jgi:hypothetical protein
MHVWQFLAPFLLTGCIGSAAVDDHILIADRDGMVLVFEDASFSIYSFPDRWAQDDVTGLVESLHSTLSYYQALLHVAPERKITIYAHTQESYDSQEQAGLEHPFEYSFDFVCCDRHLAAHEMAHLLTYTRAGGQPRPFLDEGMAELLADWNDVKAAAPFADHAVPDFPCSSPTSIDDIYSGAGFWNHAWDFNESYPMAAQFTAVAIERSSLDRYIAEYYQPGRLGTSADGDARLESFIGMDFSEMRNEMNHTAGCN